MQEIPCLIPLDRIYEEIRNITLQPIPDGSGSAHGDRGTEGWITGLEMARLHGPGAMYAADYPHLRLAIEELLTGIGRQSIHQIMVNRLAPHSALDKHSDAAPLYSRWHLPIVTNPDVEYWDELNAEMHMRPGIWYGPIPYTNMHSVHNRSKFSRVHVVVDLE